MRLCLIRTILQNKNPSFSIKQFYKFSIVGAAVIEAMSPHSKCRHPNLYPGENVQRFHVPEDKVPWTVEFPDYRPVEFTSKKVLNMPVWADPDISEELPKVPFTYNSIDKHYNVNRSSHTGDYAMENGRPRNPFGRTGMTGRGLLGRWGPNHAADPIVTRWKLDKDGKKVVNNGKPVLEFVAIQRKDTSEWAIPGGMVNPGDNVPNTLKAEFGEEALNSLEATEEEKKQLSAFIDKLFGNGKTIYSGYVDDPRNTDNSWMESVAVNFHDDEGLALTKINLQAGDDAKDVQWKTADSKLNLYASHSRFIADTCKLHNAHF